MYTDEIKNALFEYTLRMADDRLILGHRLSELCGHGPILEEDIALTNIALDLIGQAVLILKYAGETEGKGRDEDKLAYFRGDREYRNLLITEQPNGDFAQTIARQFFFDAFEIFFFEELSKSADEQLKAIAEKSIKETRYHLRHTSQWMLKLGDGTEESHERLQNAVNELWRFTDEFFQMDETDKILINAGIVPDLAVIKEKWVQNVSDVLKTATLDIPAENTFMQYGGRKGRHTEYLGYILNEMQFLTRSMPEAGW